MKSYLEFVSLILTLGISTSLCRYFARYWFRGHIVHISTIRWLINKASELVIELWKKFFTLSKSICIHILTAWTIRCVKKLDIKVITLRSTLSYTLNILYFLMSSIIFLCWLIVLTLKCRTYISNHNQDK